MVYVGCELKLNFIQNLIFFFWLNYGVFELLFVKTAYWEIASTNNVFVSPLYFIRIFSIDQFQRYEDIKLPFPFLDFLRTVLHRTKLSNQRCSFIAKTPRLLHIRRFLFRSWKQQFHQHHPGFPRQFHALRWNFLQISDRKILRRPSHPRFHR